LRHKPLISVVMPVYNPNPIHLDETIRSVRMQLYPHWELCIADDASTDRKVRQVIDRNAKLDSRIKAVYRKTNGHISQATNSALELAHGEFVAFLDHDDTLSERALYWVAAELEAHPQTDILYSDSDFVDDDGRRYKPYFKPDFNLELMLGHNLVNHLGVYRRSLVEAVGGMRVGLEGSQDYDLLLRVLGRSAVERVRHIPAVLYHWRRSDEAPTYSMRDLDRCVKTARKAVTEFLASKNIKADVLPAPATAIWQRIRYHLPEPAPKVSVIIPTKNKFKLLQNCVRGVLNDTDYPSLEVVIVDHESDDVQTKALLKELANDPRVRVLPYVGPFNFSAINNFAVANADGEILAFLNNDLEIMHSDWLREMVSHVVRPKIGAVGAKLYYPNGTIQHAGVIIGMGGVAGHQFCKMPHDFPGPNGETILVHELSAVTGACMVVRRSTFVEAGGFDDVNLPIAFNDIDFCLRLRELGYRNIFTPFAEFIHHESASRGSDHVPQQFERFKRECEYMYVGTI
jgi:O-antigen biosynthesis protein